MSRGAYFTLSLEYTKTDEWLLAQVIEQYFFSHEAFNMQRHVFFTTVILFSSMFSTSTITYPDAPSIILADDSITHHL
jgi:hypothetical protein